MNEILDNVANQIVLSGYDNKLLAGAIITGGGINLKNMEEAFVKRTKIEKVRVAKETQISLKGLEVKKDGSQNTLIALLAAGKENCCLMRTETKETVRPKVHVQESLFTPEGESAEAARDEEERQRQLEKEAIIAEQKAKKEAQKAAEEEEKRKAEEEKKRKVKCEELIQEAYQYSFLL